MRDAEGRKKEASKAIYTRVHIESLGTRLRTLQCHNRFATLLQIEILHCSKKQLNRQTERSPDDERVGQCSEKCQW